MEEQSTFTIGGKEIVLSRSLIEEAVRNSEPGVISRYSVVVSGSRYPIKQVVSLASSVPPAVFMVTDAYRVLTKLGFEIQADEMPSADADFEEFNRGVPNFLPAVQDGFEAIVALASEVDLKDENAIKPESVVAMLTGSLAEDLHDVLVLCSNERRNGAVRLLRTPYEKFLYASHISKHSEAARDFMMFDAIQAKALLGGIEKYHSHKISIEGQARLEEMFKIAQAHFKKTKCKECGDTAPRMWTKVTPEEMAKAAGMEDLYTIAYRHATLMIHPTFRGISDQMKDILKMPAILIAIFRLTLETLKLQWKLFKKDGTATGKAADVMRGLYDVMAELSTPREEWVR